MKRIFIMIHILLSTIVFAEEQKAYPDETFLASGIPIVDIRTPAEWAQTGIVEGSQTLMFFDEQGRYDGEKFLQELDMLIDKEQPFAIICRTGRRTGIVASFLDKNGYQVIDLLGGITYMQKAGIPLAPYTP